MAVAEISRERKIREARRLRGEGWTAREIASFLGANESTVRNWYLGGECPDCGTPVDRSSPDRDGHRCEACGHKKSKVWTAEVIIDRIREWTDLHGQPPCVQDWNPWLITNDRRGEAFEDFRGGNWPHVSTVQEIFSSWNAAVEAAGFTPREPGERGPDRVPRNRKVAA
jgi:Homing endonuclease associated repeat